MEFSLIPQVVDGGHIALLTVCVGLFGAMWCKCSKSACASGMNKQEVEADKNEPISTNTVQSVEPKSAQQLLALMQAEGRLVDFLQEDLEGASDEDIGAVARTIHEGGRKVLDTYFELQPVRSEDEESTVTLEEGFDAKSVRVVGRVVGQAPFTGRLIHKGWKVTQTKLPQVTDGHDVSVIAPAEVEL